MQFKLQKEFDVGWNINLDVLGIATVCDRWHLSGAVYEKSRILMQWAAYCGIKADFSTFVV